MNRNFSLRGVSPKAFLILAIMSLFAVSCSSGDEAAGPRTRNAGSEATIAACQESWGSVITVDEENQLLADLAVAVASLEVAKSTFLSDAENAQQKLDSLDLVAFNANLRIGKDADAAETIQAEVETITELPSSWESVVAAFQTVIEIEQKLLLANVINPSGAGDIVTPITDNDEMNTTSYSSADSPESAIENYEDANNTADELRNRAEELEAQLATNQNLQNEEDNLYSQFDAEAEEFLISRGIDPNEENDPWEEIWRIQETIIGKAFGGNRDDHVDLYIEAGGPATDVAGDNIQRIQRFEDASWGSVGLSFILESGKDLLTAQDIIDVTEANNLFQRQIQTGDYTGEENWRWDNVLENELDEVLEELAQAEETAGDVQDDGRAGFGNDTGFVVQTGLDPCVQLKEDILAEGVVKLLSALQSVLAQSPSTMVNVNSDSPVDKAAVLESAAAADDSDSDGGVGVVVSAYQVSADNDEQVQIPTVVMLADNATVELEEIVSEIVITPAAAQQMMVNAGVSQGSVVVKADGEWQIVDLESIVIPVNSDSNAVEFRVVPAEPSEPVVVQTVALKRTPVQQLQTIEQFAAAITPLSSDDSSSLTWVLYVVIVVLAVGVAVIFVQRRKSMATN